jgi:GNAT superfamily N-acetyltransferase
MGRLMMSRAQGDHILPQPEGMVLRASLDPTSGVLDQFYEGYDRAFILPDEKEDLEGFQTCLSLNGRPASGQAEVVAVICQADGQRLAGLNFLAVDHGAQAQPRVSVALNYVYVEEAARGRGLLRQALKAVADLALWALGLDDDGAPVVIFIEQNDPLKLSEDEYRRDTDHSGVDQVARLAIWARMGARLVDFDYIQPALSEDQAADDGLAYAVMGWDADTMPAAFLHRHLERFFTVSVLKGQAETRGGAAGKQLTELAAQAHPVTLLSMQRALDVLARDPRGGGAESLRALARQGLGHDTGGRDQNHVEL